MTPYTRLPSGLLVPDPRCPAPPARPGTDPRTDGPLTVSVLDTVTGEWRTRRSEASTYSWTEGNWSCDCNRALQFFPEHDRDDGYCMGCVRYRVVAVVPLLPGYTLADFNEGYPEASSSGPSSRP